MSFYHEVRVMIKMSINCEMNYWIIDVKMNHLINKNIYIIANHYIINGE
jgi:hypothetical protein